jgi:hypothetical protein
MAASIARRQSTSARSFPPLDRDPYSVGEVAASGPYRKAAERLLSSAREPLSRDERLGRRLTPTKKLTRLMFLHREAVTEELRGRTSVARFWWNRVSEQWSELADSSSAWSDLAAELQQDGDTGASAEGLRRCVAHELQIDTHLAFCNDALAVGSGDTTNERVRTHFERACQYACDETVREDLRVQLAMLEIDWSARSGRLADAATAAAELVKKYPDRPEFVRRFRTLRDQAEQAASDTATRISLARLSAGFEPNRLEYQDTLIQLHVLSALEEAEPQGATDDAASRRRADRLRTGATTVENLHQEFPNCRSVFDGLAALLRAQAISLANGNRPSQALVPIERALACSAGNDEELLADRKQIERLLGDLQEQVKELNKQLKPRYEHGQYVTPQLNFEGLALVEEAKVGTQPRDKMHRSKELRILRENAAKTRLRDLWLRVGLPIPESDWDEKATLFDQTFDRALAKDPTDETSMFAAWLEAAAESNEAWLTEIDPAAVVTYVTKRMQPTDDPQPTAGETPADELKASGGDETATRDGDAVNSEVTTDQVVPRLHAAATASSSDDEEPPFEFWFASREARGLKTALVAAAVLLIFAGGLTAYDAVQRSRRDAAFARLLDSVRKTDEAAAAEAVAEFRRAEPLSLSEPRADAVDRLGKRMIELGEERMRTAAYDKLQTAVADYNGDETTKFAGEFLALRGNEVDPRRDDVLRLQRDVPDLPNRKLRDAAYQRLVDAQARQNDLEILPAAEAFLQAGPTVPERADPRTAEVRNAYAGSFTRWLLGRPAELQEDELQRVEKYNALAAKIP